MATRIDCLQREIMHRLYRLANQCGRWKHSRPVIDHSQVVGCDKQRAGTPNQRNGVPALALVTPYKFTNWPAVKVAWPEDLSATRKRMAYENSDPIVPRRASRKSRQGGRGWTERGEGNLGWCAWGGRSFSHWNLQRRSGASLRSSPGHPDRTFLQMSSDDDQDLTDYLFWLLTFQRAVKTSFTFAFDAV